MNPIDISFVHSSFIVLKSSFLSGKTLDLSYRKSQLENLARGIKEMELSFHEALNKDLRNPIAFHTLANTSYSLSAVNNTIQNLKKWTKPTKIDTPIVMAPASSYTEPEPYGVVLIEGSWDYPMSHIINNLAPAIAAGNCVIVKPSEICPETSRKIAELFNKYLDQKCYRCIEGGEEVSKALIKQNFDMIMFMGSTDKGKEVAKIAAENLIPCVLLLGGKNPTIVNREANIENAALRVARGRMVNAGQAWKGCDYIFVHKDIKEKFVSTIKEKLIQFYGEDPSKSPDYGRIVNTAQTERLKAFLDEEHHGKVLLGGEVRVDEKYVAPTIILNPSHDSRLMKEEVFGPILILLEFDHIDTVIKVINHKPKAAMMYYFGSESSEAFKLLKKNTSSGALIVNESVMAVGNTHLPLGGVGGSGYGKFNGYNSFKSFSHMKSVMVCNTQNGFPGSALFPPYTETSIKVIKFAGGKISQVKQRHLLYLALTVILILFLSIMFKRSK